MDFILIIDDASLADKPTRRALDELSDLLIYLRVWRIEKHVYVNALMPPSEYYHRDIFFQVLEFIIFIWTIRSYRSWVLWTSDMWPCYSSVVSFAPISSLTIVNTCGIWISCHVLACLRLSTEHSRLNRLLILSSLNVSSLPLSNTSAYKQGLGSEILMVTYGLLPLLAMSWLY